ncbi:hypothetical protein DCS_05498 [Drechmeria coniospora]|uniref:Uncharacterized protein n=1 Tax=Drechmeria coniospora TaxID=98403 RepID=A0A151GNB2_DRECN|nr:hypothetical protein DCS_05498 [Drechmeria coniospora]KYK58482.1 hypothetical protein DCS_05498 [Drechmeria coniospora]ODA83871.1 hypothetical protein RJ55_02387 [Drechmeria coniospora]
MSDSEPESSIFKVYITADLDKVTVMRALCGDDEEDAENFDPMLFRGQTTQQVIRYHREEVSNEYHGHSKLLIVFDDEDLLRRGVLLVSLREYHGFDDAVRCPPEHANVYVSALGIDNEDWYAVRLDVPDDMTPAEPVDWFGLYNLLPDSRRHVFDEAVRAMNKGLQDVGVDVSSDDGEDGEADDLPRLYRPLHPARRDVAKVKSDHGLHARRHGLDRRRFAVVDEHYETRGALVVQLEPSDSFRCRNEAAGEILRWLFINFMTWDEAKRFAATQ